jgi:hypothetical protein
MLSYLVFPKLERYFPRKKIVNDIDSLVVMFQDLLNQKKEDKGNDMLTYMLDDVSKCSFVRFKFIEIRSE